MGTTSGPRGLYSIQNHSEDPWDGFLRGVGLFILLAFAAVWLGTEWTAYRLGFQAVLGKTIVPHVYAPWSGAEWAFRFHASADPRVHAAFTQGTILDLIGLAVAFAVAAWFGRRAMLHSQVHSDLHGSAHWATEEEIEKTGLIGKGSGVYVGAFLDKKGRKRYLRHDGPEHVLVFAPTRSGKGVGLVLPTLLSWPHSCVVHDIKGENFALTSGWRGGELGSRTLKFNPAENDGSSCRFNPLAEIRLRTDYEIEDVQNVVNMLVDPDGKGSEGENAHWTATASALLLGVVLHILYFEKDKSLTGVSHFLSDPSFDSPEMMYNYMLLSPHDPTGEMGWVDTAGAPTATHPVVAMAAREMLNRDPKEGSSILSTAIRYFTLFRDPIVAKNIAQSDFTIRSLMNDEKPVSLYLVVPPSEMERLKPLTRLIINQILRTLTAEMSFAGGKSVAGYKHRLLMMIDELPSLGNLEILQKALAFMAGYGIKSYLITQDVAQLAAAYGGASGNHESVMANCHVQIAYAPNKIETAELLSKMAGTMTVRNELRSYSGSRVGFKTQVSINTQENERALITPDEVRRLPPDDMLVFIAGHSPVYGKKIKYYEDPTFDARSKVPPVISDGRLPVELVEPDVPEPAGIVAVGPTPS
jgi:type IV secretion system protein VirD4